MKDRIVIGTRGSKLALIQSNWVADELRKANPGLTVELEILKTAGDRVQSAPFAAVGATGIFVKELESAISDGGVDLAVHSLKDVQTELHPGLVIAATPERESARDVLISKDGLEFDDLPDGAVVGTSSARRRGIVASENPKLEIHECRGNLPTRVEKLKRGNFDAILLAEAGLNRMGMSEIITEYLDIHRFVPATGQGAIGIEIREDDSDTLEIVKPLNHDATLAACNEEREFLAAIGGGCHAPIGGYMFLDGDEAVFLAFVGTSDGGWSAKREIKCPVGKAEGIGVRMAEIVRGIDGSEVFFEEVARSG